MSMLALLAFATLAGGTPPVNGADPEDEASRNSHFLHVGARALDDDDFYEPVENEGVLGYEFVHDFTDSSRAGLGLELGVFLAANSDDELGFDVTAAFVEGSVGLRGHLNAGPVQFFAGAGPTFVLAAFDIEGGPDENDTSTGFYAHGGVLFKFNRTFGMGLDARAVSGTEMNFDGFVETDADYGQVALVFAWNS